MKRRDGFVSNSSSSSFCVIGFELPKNFTEEDILRLVGKNVEGLDEDQLLDAYFELRWGGPGNIVVVENARGTTTYIGVSVMEKSSEGEVKGINGTLDDVKAKLSPIQSQLPVENRETVIVVGTTQC